MKLGMGLLSLSSGQILSGSRDELGFGANTTGKRRFRSSSDSHCSGESPGDSLSLIRDAAFHRHRGAQVQNRAEIRKGLWSGHALVRGAKATLQFASERSVRSMRAFQLSKAINAERVGCLRCQQE